VTEAAEDDPEDAAVAAAASLAARLGDLAGTMSDEDRRTFATLLLSAMDPVSKRRWQPLQGLRPDEAALLESLASDGRDTDAGHRE
jgi:hypothetical protein